MEILAPAGNILALKAAVGSGANAVYLGVDTFNARLKADNFTTQNLAEWVGYCHLYNVKVYLALNTNVKDCEIEQLRDIVLTAKNANVDALIVADMAVVAVAKEIAPNIPLHASTQLGIYNLYGARIAKDLGFSRVVLSREATLDEIVDIKSNCDIEVEYFVHGALCVSFSGGCLISSIAGGNSGNRGGCLQLCRKEYSNNLSGKSGYFLSCKDQCLVDKLPKLKTAGVDSIKIEGRMKSPEYVATTVASYAKAMRLKPLTTDEVYKLKAVFNRGDFTHGYSFGDDIIFPYIQGHFGVRVGRVTACKRLGSEFLAIAIMSRDVAAGSGVKFIFNNREIGGSQLNGILHGEEFQFKVTCELPIGTYIHVTSDVDIKCSDDVKIPVSIEYSARLGELFSITASCGEVKSSFISDFAVVAASNMPITSLNIANQLSKLGGTEFVIDAISGAMDDNIFVPNGVLNVCRREAVASLATQLLQKYNKAMPVVNTAKFAISNVFTKQPNGDIIELSRALCRYSIDKTYVINYSKINISILKNALNENNIYIKLPKFALNKDFYAIVEDIKALPKSIGIYADNISAVELARETSRSLMLGFGMNIMNGIAPKVYNCDNFCVSPELNREEASRLNGYCYAYGYLPVMTLAHCPYKVVSGNSCGNCRHTDFSYSDKFGEYRIVRNKLNKCYFSLLNSACHKVVEGNFDKYIDLSAFTEREVDDYLTTGTLPNTPKVTFGHYKRGVN